MEKSHRDRRLQDPLVSDRQCKKMLLGFLGNGDAEGHGLCRYVCVITLKA